MNIHDIESIFDTKILARGKAYFEDGNVRNTYRVDSTHYNALVEGTEMYSVAVTLLPDGEIRSLSCTCPYALDNNCKHEAAVLLSMQNGLTDNSSLEQLADRLNSCRKADIIKAIVETAYNNADLTSGIMRNIERYTTKDMLKHFRSAIDDAVCKSGYYSEKLERAVNETLDMIKASNSISKQTQTALVMLETLNDIAAQTQHNDHLLYRLMDDIAQVLAKINEKLISGSNKAAISNQWEWLLSEQIALYFEDSEVRWFTILMPFGKYKKYLDDMFDIADTLEYEDAEIKLMLASKWYNDKKLRLFIEENSDNDEVLRFAYDRAMDKNDYTSAEHFAALGHEREVRSSLEWLTCLRDIYIKTGNDKALRETLYEMTLRGSIESYIMLRQMPDSKSVIDRLLVETDNLCYEYMITSEKRTDLMIAYCRMHNASIISMVSFLAKSKYREEAKAIFEKHIKALSEIADNRKDYAKIADHICLYRSHFGRRPADMIVDDIRRLYHTRPAFMEELDKMDNRVC